MHIDSGHEIFYSELGMQRVSYRINCIIFRQPELQIQNKQALNMIKTMHHRNLNQTAGLKSFLGTSSLNKATPTCFIFLACS